MRAAYVGASRPRSRPPGEPHKPLNVGHRRVTESILNELPQPVRWRRWRSLQLLRRSARLSFHPSCAPWRFLDEPTSGQSKRRGARLDEAVQRREGPARTTRQLLEMLCGYVQLARSTACARAVRHRCRERPFRADTEPTGIPRKARYARSYWPSRPTTWPALVGVLAVLAGYKLSYTPSLPPIVIQLPPQAERPFQTPGAGNMTLLVRCV